MDNKTRSVFMTVGHLSRTAGREDLFASYPDVTPIDPQVDVRSDQGEYTFVHESTAPITKYDKRSIYVLLTHHTSKMLKDSAGWEAA